MRHWIEEQARRAASVSGLVLLAFLLQGLPAAKAQPAAEEDDDAQQAASYALQTLRVNISTDKGPNEIYSRGETLKVDFQTNEDAYLVVYHVDVDGRVSVLWPTSRFNDGFVFGRHEYHLPAEDAPRLRVAEVEGVGYVNALASRYPFDLRDLDVDFYHEPQQPAHDFFVAGDPFLAMNEVNYAVTGLEDPSEYVVSNYASYYVHRQVDHPRYLCAQCHLDDDVAVEPYDSECTVTIRYDYGWSNDWWDRYGYFPPYYYPVYVYIDPWTGSPWVNYWYRPWYDWPYSNWYRWDYACYDWHHSPYWHGDCDDAFRHGPRRYRPLDKTDLARDAGARGEAHDRSRRVTDATPDDRRVAAMKNRTVVQDRRAVDQRAEARDGQVAAGGHGLRNVSATTHAISKFPRSEGARAGAGLRLPEGRAAGSRRGDVDARETGKSPGTRTPATTPRDAGRGHGAADANRTGDGVRIRPVEPRDGTSPTWSGRRSAPARGADSAPTDPARGSSRSRVEKKESPRQDGGREAAPAPRAGGDSGRGGGSRDNDSRGNSGNSGASGGASGGGDRGGSSGGGGDRGGSSGGGGRTRGGR